MMRSSNKSRFLVHLSSPLLAAVLAGGFLTSAPLIDGATHPAAAQASRVRADFRAALAPYGRWERSARWGEVWMPSDRPRDWRPYTVGRWVYTDDWGWYWASDPEEDDWGWVVYHYGRWAFDPDLGWVWISGDEWGPGFVQWRRGTEYIGWAPLAPDEEAVLDDRDQPDVWVFVRTRDFTAPRIETVILPEREYTSFVRDTVVVNRTVELRDRGFAVNPGIAPGIIAAAVGRPIRPYEVSPRVLAGTSRIAGATEVRADQLRARPSIRETLRQSTQQIGPATRVAQPQPLDRNERGRLGANPPRAALSQAQPGVPQGRSNQPPRTQGLAPREEQRQPPRTQGLAPPEEQRQPPQVQRQQVPQQPQIQRQPPRTQGLAPREEQRQSPQIQRQQAPQQPQIQRQPPRTEGLVVPRQQPQVQRQQAPQQPQIQRQPQAMRPQMPQQQPQVQRQPPRTEGFGGGQRGGPPPAAAQRPAAPPAATEGRGGGGPQRERRP